MFSHSYKRNAFSKSLPFILVLISTTIYIVIMSYISIMKYLTFNATVADLGINNEVLWLLIHGGITNFNASGFSSVYPLQYEKPIIFIVAGLYYLFPSIYFLLILQSFVIGIAAIPLYYIGKFIIGSSSISSFIAISYFLFFPLTSANLFDFHFMTFTPLAYFLLVMFWVYNKRLLTVIASFFLASINPLTLLMTIFFLIWIISKGLFNRIENTHKSANATLKDHAYLLFVIFFLILLIYLYKYTGNIYISSYIISEGANSSGVLGTIFFSINAKLELFIYLFASVAFISLLDFSTLFLLLPYVGYVFYSMDSANFSIFGLMYPIMSAGPIYFGLIIVIGKTRFNDLEKNNDLGNHYAKKPQYFYHRNIMRNLQIIYSKQVTKMLIALGICAFLFGIVYSPISPINNDVGGGYFAGNHNTNVLITYTSEDQFLWKMIKLIPENASVITENDFPQLSGREHFETGFSHSSAWQYNYMFTSLYFNNYENQAEFISLMNQNLRSGAFGIYAEGMGGVLLKENYNGSPILYRPTDLNFSLASLSLGPGATINGSNLVDSTAGYDFWFGPYINILPGNYTATFYLSSSKISAENISLINLDVAVGPNATILNSTEVNTSSFITSNSVVAFSLDFSTKLITTDLQLRGMFPTGFSQITLYKISLIQNS